jgi:16S rRNA (guanine(1405)-N(7))-methyltransferase
LKYDIFISMLDYREELLDQIVGDVLNSKPYRHVEPALVRSIARTEIEKRRSQKETVKAVKNKLHQVGGVYLDKTMPYTAWLDGLRATCDLDDDQFHTTLRVLMGHHASTRERLPDLDTFYRTCLQELPPATSVLDVACGLNPLAIPWMGLAENARYIAIDIYHDMMEFIAGTMTLCAVNGEAITGDVITACPNQPVDLALVLKTIPCLEQLDKSAGERLLSLIQAEVMLVSFPLRSLGGRNVGMAINYERRFLDIADRKKWKTERFIFKNEMVFRVFQ